MQFGDLSVEVRDINLERKGALVNGYQLEATPLLNQTGAWTLTLAADHPLAEELSKPGSGLVVSDQYDTIISGPTTSPARTATGGRNTEQVVFEGTCDNVHGADRLAYPEPGNADTRTQSTDYDTRTGPAETVLHGFVSSNLGPDAPVERRHPRLVMGEDRAQGEVVTKAARFDNLAELTAGIANTAGIRQRIVQQGESLVYQTTTTQDRSRTIRLDAANGTLSGYRMTTTAPSATHAIVGAQDVSLDRLFATVSTDESVAASGAWGRRIETFVNQSYQLDEEVWTESAHELLAEQGEAIVNVQATPHEHSPIVFGRDWNIGDKVTVVAGDEEYVSTVTGIALKVDEDGVRLGAMLGDVTAFNKVAALTKATQRVARRVSTLERNAVAAVDTAWTTLTPLNGWSNLGGIYAPASYRRVGDQVFLRGIVHNGTIGGVMVNLPAECRPVYPLVTSGMTNGIRTGPPSEALAHNHAVSDVGCRIDISTNGDVIAGADNADPVYISLDGMSFLVG